MKETSCIVCEKCKEEIEIPECDIPKNMYGNLYCIKCFKEMTFEYKGFECQIIQRPDLYYAYQVSGYRESDKMFFNPKIKFSKNLIIEQIRTAAISMIDGTFKGKVEVYNNIQLMVS